MIGYKEVDVVEIRRGLQMGEIRGRGQEGDTGISGINTVPVLMELIVQ